MYSLQNLSFVHAGDENKHEAIRERASALLQIDDAGAGRRGAESLSPSLHLPEDGVYFGCLPM
ncbi:hypothetical protein [Bacteroides pyogenes]|uniref:Uncharacterized protein n=1 Tax=Bacteroides pyogenes JCM 6292 TaxID=1235809 RepID=W4P3C4_9BACE|nr:hypothetical protein [Bacteroides pyogenes]MCE9106798.1 hypothetical protein [Bacteroides pyogenes]MDY5433267.1 hypothetical protein [Bacteroides pyogenes]GAE14191.1 hypothetical protein JCM6292_292 [Bacteroides pyogenes JCM 6292]